MSSESAAASTTTPAATANTSTTSDTTAPAVTATGSSILTPLYNTFSPAAATAAGSSGKGKGQLQTSGRRGATRELAQQQYDDAVGLAARVETATAAVVAALGDAGVTEEELRDHVAGLMTLRDELDNVDLSAIAAKDSHPLWITVSARGATLATLVEVINVRVNASSVSATTTAARSPRASTPCSSRPSP